MPKLKFRMALLEWPWFSKGDWAIFRIDLAERKNTIHGDVHYFETDTFDEGRAKMHELVDNMFDHENHMQQLERISADNKRRFLAENADLKSVSELVIGRAPKKESKPADDLLDLMGDVLGPDENGKAK